MLTLSIREKNGEERQLVFDKEEVTIGRASGSDIVLPRNNISKRHARLVDKHDKVVIVDLRSTNGTYVNGRRITAPELLTGEDKVYIGDFVIKLQRAGDLARATAPFGAAAPPAMPVDPRTSHAPTVAVATPPQHLIEEDAAARAIAALEQAESGPPPFEDDDDEQEESTQALNLADFAELEAAMAAPPKPSPPPPPPAAPEVAAPAAPAPAAPAPEVAAPAPPPAPEAPAPVAAGEEVDGATREDDLALDAWAEWNATVALVLDGVEAEVGHAPGWDEALAVTEAWVGRAVAAGQIAADVEREALVLDVVAELAGLGPFVDLLADTELTRIVADAPDVLRVWRGGVAEPVGRVFSSGASYERVVARLVARVGHDPATAPAVVDGALDGGASVTVVRAPIAARASLVVIKRTGGAAGVGSLGDVGGLTAATADALTAALAAGRNVVVSGRPGSGRTRLVSAIAGLSSQDERLVIVGDGAEVVTHHRDVVRLSRASGRLGVEDVYARAGRLGADRIIVDDVDGDNASAFVNLALAGGAPVLAAARDADPDRLLRRLAMQLELASGGLSGERARAIVGEVIDVIVAVERGDGAPRVTSVVEVHGTQDGFTLRVLAQQA